MTDSIKVYFYWTFLQIHIRLLQQSPLIIFATEPAQNISHELLWLSKLYKIQVFLCLKNAYDKVIFKTLKCNDKI